MAVEGEYEGPDRPERSVGAREYVGRTEVLERVWTALRALGVTEANVGQHQLWPIFDVIADAYDAGDEGDPFRGFAAWTSNPDTFEAMRRDISDQITRMDFVDRSLYDVVPTAGAAVHRRRALRQLKGDSGSPLAARQHSNADEPEG